MATVYLGQDEIRLAHGEERRLVAEAMPIAQALPLLLEALRPLGRRRVRVLVSGAWCQPFLLPTVEGVNSNAEWLQVAAGLLHDITGMPAGSRLWLDHAQGSPPLAVALHPEVDALLMVLAAKKQVQEVQPWWGAVLAAHAAFSSGDRQSGIAVVDSDAVTLLLADGERYEMAQSYSLMGETASSVLARALISQGRHVGEVTVKQMLRGSAAQALSSADSVPFLERAP